MAMTKREKMTCDFAAEEDVASAVLRYAASRGDEKAQEKVNQMDEALEKENANVANVRPPVVKKTESAKKCGGAVEVQAKDAIEMMRKRVKEDPSYFDGHVQLINYLKKATGREPELREAYETVLSEYPLCYGYWTRLALMEQNSWEQKCKVFEQGLQYVPTNPHLWLAYLELAMGEEGGKGRRPVEEVRALADRAIEECGLHWNSFNVWIRCVEFEELHLKSLCGSELDHLEKLRQEQACIQRIRLIYSRALETPISKLSGLWEKFKVLLGEGKTGVAQTVSLDVTDLLVEAELEEFQKFVIENYIKKDTSDASEVTSAAGSSGAVIKVTGDKENPESCEVCNISLEVEYPDGSSISIHTRSSVTTEELAEVCVSHSSLAKRGGVAKGSAVDLLFAGRVLKAHNTLEAEGVTSNSRIVFFDGSTLAKALELTSGRAVEKWFLRMRERLYNRTCEKRERLASFECQLKRNYFHPLPLGLEQLSVWRDYLDSEEAEGNEKSTKVLYHRAIETCCCYAEFWKRYAGVFEKNGKTSAASKVYEYASSHFLKRRPDIRLLYSTFVEKCGDVKKAENLIRKDVLCQSSGVAPGLIEGYVRLVGLLRRRGELDECEKVLDEGIKFRDDVPLDRCKLVMEKAYFLLNHRKNINDAISVLRDEWHRSRDISLFKYYASMLRMPNGGDFEDIMEAYKEAVVEPSISLVNRWMIWKDFIFFVEHESKDVNEIAEAKEQFSDFLRKNAKALEMCRRRRRSEDHQSEAKKKVKVAETPQQWTSAEWMNYQTAQQQLGYAVDYSQCYMAYYHQMETAAAAGGGGAASTSGN